MEKIVVRDKDDRRSERTRQSLSQALIALLFEKSYTAITVQDIVDRANVGRSTFYAHYQDKDNLLSSQLEWLIEELRQNVESQEKVGNSLLPSLELFRHVQGHYTLYKALVIWGSGFEFFLKIFQVFLSRDIENQLHKLLEGRQTSPIPLSIVANYVAVSFFTLTKWWLDNGMVYSPEYMNELFLQLVMPGVQASLGVSL